MPAAQLGEPGHGIRAELSSVLVCDDEHLVASGITAHLTELGYEVIGPASNARQSIALCETECPDLALMDIQMPGESGLIAARTIFEKHGIPVVIVSAYADSEYVEDAGQTGVFGYLLKPVTRDQLNVAVSVAWKRFREYAEQHEEIVMLRQRLADRKVIEQAKWILVKTQQIDEADAMRLLQRHARNNRRSLADVAATVIEDSGLEDLR